MPIVDVHCAFCGARAKYKDVCCEGVPVAFALTSDGKHPCPACGSLAFVHPQGLDEWPNGWCPTCEQWLEVDGQEATCP